MAEAEGRERGRAPITPSSVTPDDISLDEALDLAFQHARNNREFYGRYATVDLVRGFVRTREAQEYYVPLLVVDGNFNQIDAITALRLIAASEIVAIRLYKSSMVPPMYRRPGAEGGVIEVTTR